MYVIIVDHRVKPEHRDDWIAAATRDARGSVENEPGCLRFDIVQDGEDPNRFYFYEVYIDEAAFKAHLQQPHYLRWREEAKDFYLAPTAALTGRNIFPTDADWPGKRAS